MPAEIVNEARYFVMMSRDLLLNEDVGNVAKVLYLHLWDYSDRASRLSHPSRKTLATRLRVGLATVDRAVKELVDVGAIEIFPRFTAEGDRTSNGYRILMMRGGPKSDTTPLLISDTTPSSPQVEEPEPLEPEPVISREELGRDVVATEQPLLTRGEMSRAFEQAYATWPKKVKREEAWMRFQHVISLPAADRKRARMEWLRDQIMLFGHAYSRTTDNKYVPALGPWLYQKRWTDELPKAEGRTTAARKNLGTVRYFEERQNQQKGIEE